MAVLKSSEGIFLNNYYSLNNNYGCKIFSSTRTWTAYQTGINNFEIYQSGTTSTRQTISIALKWAAIRTSGSKTELPALHASARASLNTNGTISFDSGWDWHAYGGNGILWPSIGMGGSSLFIGADSGASTGVIGSAWITICTLEWDKLFVNTYSD